MKIKCYECKKLFESTTGFYTEHRVIEPDTIPAGTMPTGYGFCSQKCAESHHILENDIDFQDKGNYEEAESSIIMTSPDGGIRGEVLKVRDMKKK